MTHIVNVWHRRFKPLHPSFPENSQALEEAHWKSH